MRIRFERQGAVMGFPWEGLQMRWHFVDGEGRRCQERGSNVRVDVNGRCVPTYRVARHKNWGFILQVHCPNISIDAYLPADFSYSQNIWVAYFSFPMPPIDDQEDLSDGSVRPKPPLSLCLSCL